MNLSDDAILNRIKMSHQEPCDVVKDYLSCPILPLDKDIIITKIATINYDHVNMKYGESLKYKDFHEFDKNQFTLPQKNGDYELDDYISPIYVFAKLNNEDNIIKYRTIDLLWFPLTNITTGIFIKQQHISKELLPFSVFVDKNHQWLTKLMDLVGRNILEHVHSKSNTTKQKTYYCSICERGFNKMFMGEENINNIVCPKCNKDVKINDIKDDILNIARELYQLDEDRLDLLLNVTKSANLFNLAEIILKIEQSWKHRNKYDVLNCIERYEIKENETTKSYKKSIFDKYAKILSSINKNYSVFSFKL